MNDTLFQRGEAIQKKNAFLASDHKVVNSWDYWHDPLVEMRFKEFYHRLTVSDFFLRLTLLSNMDYWHDPFMGRRFKEFHHRLTVGDF